MKITHFNRMFGLCSGMLVKKTDVTHGGVGRLKVQEHNVTLGKTITKAVYVKQTQNGRFSWKKQNKMQTYITN